jgi:hypothetical protein
VRRRPARSMRLLIIVACLGLVGPLSSAAPALAAGPVIGGVEITVPKGNRISGTLENGDGDPIPGMSIAACALPLEDCRGEALTAGDGTFTVRGLIPDTYAIRFAPVDNSDYLLGWYTPTGPVDTSGDATPIDATGGDVANIAAVAANGHSISGTLTKATGGALAGVAVFATGDTQGGADTTDGSGHYTIRGLVDDGYRLSIRIPPTMNFRSGGVLGGGVVQDESGGSVVNVSGADVAAINVVAPQGLQITGRLTGPEAAGARVSAFGSSSSDEVTLNSSGQWAIRGLWPGQYQLVFSPVQVNSSDSGFPLGYWSGGSTLTADSNAAAVINLVAADVTGRNAAIPNGLSIGGKVIDETGAAIPNAAVFMCGLTSGCAFGFTSVSGAWSFNHVLADSYLVNVSDAEHPGGYFGSGGYALDQTRAKRVSVSSADVTGVDVVLPSGASIAGHVRGPLDENIVGALASAVGTHGIPPAAPGTDVTAADGTFLLPGLTEDDYVIQLNFEAPSDYLFGYFDADSPSGYTDDFNAATRITVGDAAIGSSYVPITPERVVDSRIPLGVAGVFHANTPRTFQVAGTGSIPAEAVAVTGNVTVVNQTSAGYVSLTPTATANPTSSTINFPTGDIRANNFTIPLDDSGRLAAVFKAPVGKSAHILVDITGYFVEGDANGTYAPITPARLVDTRTGVGLAGALVPNVPKTLSVAGTHGIPTDAIAITANLTVVGQTKAGYLSVTPEPMANPTTSTLNFPLADTRANGLTARLNGSGDLSIVYKASGGSTHVVMDVTGYYIDEPTGLLFYPLSPGRIIDSRPSVLASELVGTFNANAPRTMEAIGHARIPLAAFAITGNLTVVGQTSAGFVAMTLDPVANPPTSTINFPASDIRANGVTVPLNIDGELSLVFKAANGRKTHLILDVTGYFR